MVKLVKRITRVLIASDFFLNTAWGFLAPVFAIFILENIQGGGPRVAGIAAAIYWMVKSVVQIPVGRYLDKNHGEKDDFLFMLCGNFLVALVPLGYLFAKKPIHLYLIQILYGLGMAINLPSWFAIFTRHITKGKEAFEWSLKSTSLGLGVGAAGMAGGFLVAIFGFKIVFILVSGLNIFSGFLLLLIRKEMSKENIKIPRFPPFKRPFNS